MFNDDVFFCQEFSEEAVNYSEELELFYDKLCGNYHLLNLNEGDSTTGFGSGGVWAECLLVQKKALPKKVTLEKRFYRINFQAEPIRLCVIRKLDLNGEEQMLNLFFMDEWDGSDINNRGHYDEFMSDMDAYDGDAPLEIIRNSAN